jgi:hypothetical protein
MRLEVAMDRDFNPPAVLAALGGELKVVRGWLDGPGLLGAASFELNANSPLAAVDPITPVTVGVEGSSGLAEPEGTSVSSFLRLLPSCKY